MTLSDLVLFKNTLDQILINPCKAMNDLEMANIVHVMHNHTHTYFELTTQIDQQIEIIQQQIDILESKLNQVKVNTKIEILEKEKFWFGESYKLYEKEMLNETTQYILNRREELSQSQQEFFSNRLEVYADWRYPAMIVRPGLEKFTKSLVANDPLYLIDQHYDLLVPTIDQFPANYQKRLRTYVVNERGRNPILQKIPNNQFGLCLVYNFFNYRPFEVIKQWLLEIKSKLRPGGILIMTINDCDRYKAVQLVEQYYACYTPGYLILDMAKSIGFEIVYTHNDDGPSTWIELQNPGKLTSLKAGQTLAKIVSKSIANT
jgi:hypothetical protein